MSKVIQPLRKVSEVDEAKEKLLNVAKDCADGQHRQRLISEEQLETLLAEGWHVAAVLPSGKIVISSEH